MMRKTRLAMVLVVCCVLLVGTGRSARGDTFVLPPGTENKEGTGASSYPFETFLFGAPSSRLQELFDSSLFLSHPQGIIITGIAFRNTGEPTGLGRSFDTVIPELEVRMSTSARTPASMQPVFSENIGSDEKAVFPRGPLRWKTDFVPGQVQSFDLRVPLAQPFTYIPGSGSLLIDIIVRGEVKTAPTDAQVVTGQRARSVWAIGDARFGDDLSFALVTQFTFQAVPEPGGAALFTAGVGLLSFLVWRKTRFRPL